MKKSINLAFVIPILFLTIFCHPVNAQKLFRGTIRFQFTYLGNLDPAMLAQLPKFHTQLIYDNKSKEVPEYGSVQITDGDNKTVIILQDQMGDKKYVKLNEAELKEMNELKHGEKIEYIDSTKTIAGYLCKKALFSYTDDEGKLVSNTIFYSEELGNEKINFGGEYEGLKGLPMEYQLNFGEISIKVTAIEVKKGKVKDTDFLIPSEFVEMTPEEKARIMQQSGDDE
jgi:hypothetical protein